MATVSAESLPTKIEPNIISQAEATKLGAAITALQNSPGTESPSTTNHEVSAETQKLGFDPVTLKARYDEEREKRLAAHPEGAAQYRIIDDDDPVLGRYLNDPYMTEKYERGPIVEDVEVAIIGGGYSGQLVAVKLLEMGIRNFRIVEKASDFGGTWYWNRYPGVQCDIESYIYMPLLDQTDTIPSEKYARGPELLQHGRNLGKHFGLYERTLFQTEVKGLVWDALAARWNVETDHKDNIRARFTISAPGPFHRPKLPGIKGIEKFQGPSFHSSRWDYTYTGGNSYGNLHKLSEKTVGIIGTGATAVQIIPHLGNSAGQVYVFQRTPSSIDLRGNKPTDPSWFKSLGNRWQKERMDNFNILVSGGYQEVDLVGDGWTDVVRKLLPKPADDPNAKIDAAELNRTRQLIDFEKMEQIRKRVDAIVKDPETANNLKPYYNQFCKRPCFHDEYLDTFNKPNVKLIDTKGKGVEEITEKGVIVDGREYELDCIIYATGFEIATEWTHRSGYDIVGENGRKISEKWKAGASTFHGWATREFPNSFFVQLVQSGLTPNFVHVATAQAEHFAYVISEAMKRNIATLQPTQEAEDRWVNTILELGKLREDFNRECTPGYYNNEGKPSIVAAKNASYGGSAPEYLDILKRWRDAGLLEGLEVTRQSKSVG